MKKRWILPGLLVAAFAFAASGAADPGPGHGTGHGKHGKFGPYNVVTDDHGSCGNAWAVDTEKRTFTVHKNRDGSYTVLRRDRGTFLTNAGQSPGACETKGRHGATVVAGVHGKFHGYLVGRVTGTFNPNATCTTPDCGFTDVWINAFFGAGAADTFTCNLNSKACRFDFEYTAAKHQALKFRHWFDKGTGAGTLLNERFRGDIANA
jgi:hypothetical protein